MKQKKMRGKKDRRSSSLIGLLGLLLCVVIVFLILFCYITIRLQFCKERLGTLSVISSKLTQNMTVHFEGQRKNVEICANGLERLNGALDAEILDAVALEESDLGYTDARLLLFDDEGNYYTKDGYAGRWGEESLRKNRLRRFVVITSLPEGNTKQTFMLFVYRLDAPITLDGKSVTHIALARKPSTFDRDLTVGSYGKDGSAFIMHENGVRIYHQSDNDVFNNVYNVKTALKSSEFQHGMSVEKMEADIAERKSGQAHVIYKGVNYALSYQYMNINDWYSVYMIPMNAMGDSTSRFIMETVVAIGLASVAMVVIFLCVVFIVNHRWRSDQKQINLRLVAALEEAEEAKNQANQANRTKSDFLARMTHDIRTPLNGIVGMTEIAKQNLTNTDKMEDCLKKIGTSSNHLLLLVNDVLDMAQIESGKIQCVSEPFNLKKMLDEVVSIIESRIANLDLHLEQRIEGVTHAWAYGDENHLKQVLLNILSNSVKFTPKGGTISIVAEEKAAGPGEALYCLKLRDTGRGMSKAFMSHMFEAFEQERDSARTEFKGTGLGLAIVKELTDRMGGELTVHSELNVGTSFLLKLKLRTVDAEDIPDAEERALNFPDGGEKVSDRKLLAGKKVLVVEDHPINQEIAVYMLEELGAEVLVADNGKEGVETFRASAPGEFQAIFMDLMMPVMDGFEAAKKIRGMDREDAGTVPIIAMTANAYQQDRENTRAVGMNGHIAKPLNMEAMAGELEKILGEG